MIGRQKRKEVKAEFLQRKILYNDTSHQNYIELLRTLGNAHNSARGSLYSSLPQTKP